MQDNLIMLKWGILSVILMGLGYTAYQSYDAYKGGYFTRPEMPEGAFSLSYKSGLRGILVDVPEEKRTRRYLGIPLKVPFYLQDTWSWCYPPTKEYAAQVDDFMADRDWPGQRFEALCKIMVDGKEVERGIIISVPLM